MHESCARTTDPGYVQSDFVSMPMLVKPPFMSLATGLSIVKTTLKGILKSVCTFVIGSGCK